MPKSRKLIDEKQQVFDFDAPIREYEELRANLCLGLLIGGDEGDRTPGLRIANAALSQLSYIPKPDNRK